MILTISLNPAIDKIYFVKTLEKGEVHRPIDMVASAGGKGLNVSRVAKTVGGDIAATGFLGGGNGDFIRHKIAELGIKDRFISIEEETRICINITDMDDLSSTEVLEVGPNITSVEAQCFLDALNMHLDGVTVLTISGSLPKGLAQDFYYKIIQRAKMRHIKVLLDSSGEAFLEGIKAKPFLIKPNKDEIKFLYSTPTTSINSSTCATELVSIEDYVRAIQELMDHGIEMPVISMGKDGSIAGYQGKVIQARFPALEVVNTVGSGDSFLAGCAVALARSAQVDFEEVIRFGTACGCANTLNPQTGVVKIEDVQSIYQKVEIVTLIEKDKLIIK